MSMSSNVTCKFCTKECKNPNSHRNHERLCKQNPNKQKTFLEINKDLIKQMKQQGLIKCTNQFNKARELGLPVPKVSEETRNKISLNSKNKSQEDRRQASIKSAETIRKKVAEGTWHTSLARKMHYSYKGINLHGKWELRYATWLDSQNIIWERCKDQFNYIYDNKERKYTPDFYLPELGCYVEIKGYETDKDRAKWTQFPSHLTLKVLKEKDLKKLGLKVN